MGLERATDEHVALESPHEQRSLQRRARAFAGRLSQVTGAQRPAGSSRPAQARSCAEHAGPCSVLYCVRLVVNHCTFSRALICKPLHPEPDPHDPFVGGMCGG
jgi:hypothetical protein